MIVSRVKIRCFGFALMAAGLCAAPKLTRAAVLTVQLNETTVSAGSTGTFVPSITNDTPSGVAIGDYQISFTITPASGATTGTITPLGSGTLVGTGAASNELFGTQTASGSAQTLNNGAGYFVSDDDLAPGGATLAASSTQNLFNWSFTASGNASGVFDINVNTADPTFGSEVDDDGANAINTTFSGGTITVTPTPEPACLSLLGLGGLLFGRRRRRSM